MKLFKFGSMICWILGLATILVTIFMPKYSYLSFVGIGVSVIGLVLAFLGKSRDKNSRLDRYNIKNNIVTLIINIIVCILFYFDILANIL